MIYFADVLLIDGVLDNSSSIWLLDLAKDYPKATLEGFDISSAQYPHPAWLPNNVHLNTLDILSPIPKDLRGKFDIVHIGLVVLVVENDNPSALLENLLMMLSILPQLLQLLRLRLADFDSGRAERLSPVGRSRLWRALRRITQRQRPPRGTFRAER